MGRTLMDMALEVRDSEDPVAGLYEMLQIFDWNQIEKHIRRNAVMEEIGIRVYSPLTSLAASVGVALGKIQFEKGQGDLTCER